MVDSTDLAQVLAEANDISRSVSQKLTSAHLLLALYTTENRAELLLRERGVDEDRLLECLTAAPTEPEGALRDLLERSREIARNCGSREADCLHLLIGVTRVRCAAQDLLVRVGLDLTSLRNTALSYQLSGRMPRKLQLGRAPTAQGIPGAPPSPPPRPLSSRPVGAPPVPLPSSGSKVAVVPPAPAKPQATPVPSVRDLFDTDADEELAQEALEGLPAVEALAEAEPLGAPRPAPEPEPLAPGRAAPRPPGPAAGAPLMLDPKLFPMLTSLGRNLSLEAARARLDPVVGRDKEIDEVIDILGKRRTNNPCLVGEPGVGKTAVVEGVAQALLQLRGTLSERIIVELDTGTLVAGTQLRGSFSERLNAIKEEVKRAEGRLVVFIDEIHTLIGAGSTGEGAQDAANELKSAMARGDFPCIGATTHDEFRKFISQDPALERRFTPVVVDEPTIPETVQILTGVKHRYEEHHGLTYSREALEAAAALSARYINDRFLPDKAISVMDLAGSRCRREGKDLVEPRDVARVVAKVANIPEERLLVNDTERLLRLEEDLAARVIGHREAVERLARVIRRNYAGFSSRRPMGSFLFLGPTGVGKTEMARALAEVLYGSKDALVRIDMSEMAEAHAVSRLIGAPAGYVGHGEGGQLTEPVRRRPASVVVLDELEKAHRDVHMLLLQVLEEGRLTDAKGRHVDFSNTVVVMTTNLGAEAFGRTGRPMGFGAQEEAQAADTDGAVQLARRALPPELWNRIDERLPFRPLQEVDVARIASLLLADSARRLAAEKGIRYETDEAVVKHLLRSGGFDPQLGARPMRQTVQRLVEAPLAERILAGEFSPGDTVRVAVQAGQLAFQRVHR
jgi:ATP-dependent Clp protease ATP-binding subunit ClpC